MENFHNNQIVATINTIVSKAKHKKLSEINIEPELKIISDFFSISQKQAFIYSIFIYYFIQQQGCISHMIKSIGMRGCEILNYTDDIIDLCFRDMINIENSEDIDNIFALHFSLPNKIIRNISYQEKSQYDITNIHVIIATGNINSVLYSIFDNAVIKHIKSLPMIPNINDLSEYERWMIFHILVKWFNTNNSEYLFDIDIERLIEFKTNNNVVKNLVKLNIIESNPMGYNLTEKFKDEFTSHYVLGDVKEKTPF